MMENIDHLQTGQQCLDDQIRKTLANCIDSSSTSGFVSAAKDRRAWSYLFVFTIFFLNKIDSGSRGTVSILDGIILIKLNNG